MFFESANEPIARSLFQPDWLVPRLRVRRTRDKRSHGRERGPTRLPEGAVQRLSEAISIPTLSFDDHEKMDHASLAAFHRMLQRQFPRVHAILHREVIAEHSLLYCWLGSDSTLDPVLLMSHIDVVPIEVGTETDWSHPPFSGAIADGYVWGRGAIDTKSTLMGVMEAVEGLLAEGIQPRRSVYLSFGHDEEVGGGRGATAIVSLLKQRGVRFAYVLDEGGAVVPGRMFGIAPSVAAVGVAEKGMVNIEISARGGQGHASMPHADNAASRICAAIAKLDAAPWPMRLTPTLETFLSRIADYLPWPRRLLLKNLWLFGGWVMRGLAGDPAMAAALRTTQAATMLEGSSKANTLAAEARAVVNMRLLYGDCSADLLRRMERVIGDASIEVRLMTELGCSDPLPPSSLETPAFEAIADTIQELFPEAILAPMTVAGATDSRHFAPLSDHIYRFAPMRLDPEDLVRIHGTDERLSIDNYRTMVAFFRALLLRSVA